MEEALLELDWYAKLSGLRINFTKTQVVWIGSKKYSREMLCQNRDLSWGSTSFKLLGINFDIDLDKILNLNYTDRYHQIKNLINTWSKRNLTVIGKISVVKTLILPILNHLFLTLPNPNAEMIKKINDAIYYFLWNSPVHRVKKEVLHMDYKNGGLQMINIHLFMIALKCTWIRKLFSSNCKWSTILFTNMDKEKLFKLGNSYTTNTISNVKNKFWIDVFKAWQYFADKDINSTWEYFLASPLWMNKNININNKHVFYRSWYNKGIVFVNDVISNSGKFLSYGKIKDKFDISGNIMMYNSIISALNKTKMLYSRGDNKLTEPFIPSFVQTILKRKKGTKDIYWMLIPKVVPNGEKKWNQILELNELEWREIFKLPFAVTNNTKLQWLQFRYKTPLSVALACKKESGSVRPQD
ncbi:uncharacterized protein [Mytilus edulis]|uniref:uncharacterized protein n=1 Tax=Mytilus edulis TaxID=6550 RepID=UPI0039F06260